VNSGRLDWFLLWLELRSESLAEAAQQMYGDVPPKEWARLRALYKRAVDALEELGRVALAHEGASIEGDAVRLAAGLAAHTFLTTLYQAAALKLQGLEEKPAVSLALRSYYTREALEDYLVTYLAQKKVERGETSE